MKNSTASNCCLSNGKKWQIQVLVVERNPN